MCKYVCLWICAGGNRCSGVAPSSISAGAGIVGDCELPDVLLGTKLRSSAEPSFHLLFPFFLSVYVHVPLCRLWHAWGRQRTTFSQLSLSNVYPENWAWGISLSRKHPHPLTHFPSTPSFPTISTLSVFASPTNNFYHRLIFLYSAFLKKM